MDTPRITVSNLHKDFKIFDSPQDRLWEIILRKPRHQLYHVLSDISFALSDGKSLGIIGDNGAGKSTLLKLLVGTLQPSSGTVQLNGQVAALLELGAGFHPEFTGRRNIYLNASLLGVPDDNIAELEKDIIDQARSLHQAKENQAEDLLKDLTRQRLELSRDKEEIKLEKETTEAMAREQRILTHRLREEEKDFQKSKNKKLQLEVRAGKAEIQKMIESQSGATQS